MSYNKNTWASGDVITAAKLNNMEDGIETASSGGVTVVTITSNDGGKTITGDKTPAELQAILSAGGQVVARLMRSEQYSMYLSLYSYSGTDVTFRGTTIGLNQSLESCVVSTEVAATKNTWVMSTNYYPLDNGWSVDSTQIFNETLTTASGQFGYQATMAYTGDPTTLGTMTITFDGTEYTCTQQSAGDQYWWGAPAPSDFSTYPFVCLFNGARWYLITETAGEHTVVGVASVIETSSDFQTAVGKCVDVSTLPMECVSHTTTGQEMNDAYVAGRLLYFKPYESSYSYAIITDFGPDYVNFIPDNSQISVGFVDGVFTVSLT